MVLIPTRPLGEIRTRSDRVEAPVSAVYNLKLVGFDESVNVASAYDSSAAVALPRTVAPMPPNVINPSREPLASGVGDDVEPAEF